MFAVVYDHAMLYHVRLEIALLDKRACKIVCVFVDFDVEVEVCNILQALSVEIEIRNSLQALLGVYFNVEIKVRYVLRTLLSFGGDRSA